MQAIKRLGQITNSKRGARHGNVLRPLPFDTGAVIADDIGLAAPMEDDPSINLRQAHGDAKHKSLARVDGNIVKAANLPGVCRPAIDNLTSRHGIK